MNRRQRRAFMVLMWTVGFCLIGYIGGRPLYWHLNESLSTVSSCAPCHCDCSLEPLLSLPDGLNNSILDCMKQEPEEGEGSERRFTELLSQEVRQKEAIAEEKQRIADTTLLEAKKLASQYQKEADKCNSGMETCEEARERAEAALVNQMKETALWELRARQRGWKESAFKISRAHF
ncbi:uncharacterized protein LOC107482978 isoform X1 [Arachis duranensis]|uniref:Uncharacterized protein LOC107482978 isoform X1 n=1 Tax=Arachis duranensis TaxID=130453 RepID=A0A6P4D4B4_ARADU|nr:uncharacterized protein LOC107482978 isoform X1 [Arachis duranensis]XP_057756860.1 uncharacterized protein LOC130976108 [Arachis stenosperma]